MAVVYKNQEIGFVKILNLMTKSQKLVYLSTLIIKIYHK